MAYVMTQAERTALEKTFEGVMSVGLSVMNSESYSADIIRLMHQVYYELTGDTENLKDLHLVIATGLKFFQQFLKLEHVTSCDEMFLFGGLQLLKRKAIKEMDPETTKMADLLIRGLENGDKNLYKIADQCLRGKGWLIMTPEAKKFFENENI